MKAGEGNGETERKQVIAGIGGGVKWGEDGDGKWRDGKKTGCWVCLSSLFPGTWRLSFCFMEAGLVELGHKNTDANSIVVLKESKF